MSKTHATEGGQDRPAPLTTPAWAQIGLDWLLGDLGRPAGVSGSPEPGCPPPSAEEDERDRLVSLDEGRTSIGSRMANGRIQQVVLERIGRIGWLGHRAKHVIRYERRMFQSPQFPDSPAARPKDERDEAPLLRKVEEYIEILQPTRRFHDDGSRIVGMGRLTSVRFLQTRIRVDSRWGSDVAKDGWKIPLWNKACAKSPVSPQNSGDETNPVYPKPKISMILEDENGGELHREIDEPEALVFYTSTLPGEHGDDTDAWRPVGGVDAGDLALLAGAK